MIEDVVLACEELGIPAEPEITRLVDGYDKPVFIQFRTTKEGFEVLPGIFSSYKEAKTDEVEADHIHYVIRDENTSVQAFIMEDMNPRSESDEIPRISCRVSADITTQEPEKGEDYDIYPVVIKGLRVVPSLRQLNGMHPIDPRFYITG